MDNSNSVPEWLLERNESGTVRNFFSGKKKKIGFVEKTINDVANVLKESIFSEQVANKPGMLQNIDPRVKLITIVYLLVIAAFLRHMPTLVGLYMFTLIMAYFSKVPMKFFVKRVWFFIPFFTGLVVLPSIFNIIKPGDPLINLLYLGRRVDFLFIHLPETISITKQGLLGAGLIILRVGVSVSLAVLLTVTSRWSELLKSLRVFFVPKIFIMVLEMTYRYIFLLLTVMTDMYTARKSRTIGEFDAKENRRFISTGIGNVFGKAYFMSEEIHDAMISRGYLGEAKSLNRFRVLAQDVVWVILILVIGIIFIGGDKVIG